MMMKKAVDITVVIPNYNGIQYMDGCLGSLYEGSLVPEVIVVDNGSSDGSADLAEKKYPMCRVVRFRENKGFCRAVNEGIRRADTEYVILLNNDTAVDREFVFHLREAIRKRRGAFSVSAKMLSMGEPEIIDDAGDLYCALGWAYARGKGKGRENYSKSAEIFASCAGAAIYRKSVFDIIGYFDENHFAYLEDIDIGYRANIYGYPNRYEPEAVVYHAGSAVSGSRHNGFKVKLSARNSIYLIYKNMPVLQVFINLPFLLAGYLVKAAFFCLKGLGKDYLGGLREGFVLSCSKEGKARRVPFKRRNLKNYFWVQLQLWANLYRLLKK